ncbi:MAG: PEGA domain-containing protein [Panacagrimonas sp.]
MSEPGQPRIAPVPYRPAGGPAPSPRRPFNRLWLVLAAGALLTLTAVVFFVLARTVTLEISPRPGQVSLDGGFGLSLGSSHLLLPGRYRLHASGKGFADLAAEFTVTDAPQQTFHFEMAKLPGTLALQSRPVAEVFIDGNARGSTPLPALQLAPGPHRLMLRAPRYQVHESQVVIEGGGVVQTLSVDLVPGWAPVTVSSSPAGAEILLDGVSSGHTPQTLEVGSGAHRVELKLAGYAAWRDTLNVASKEPLTLPTVKLLPAEGVLKLSSQPAGASVNVDGEFRGQTPLALHLAPGRPHRLQVSAPGYRTAERSAEVAAESSQELSVALDPILGTVVLDLSPADAQLRIDGKTAAAGTLQLSATAHRIEASKPGFAPYTGTVTPRPGVEQKVSIHLLSEADAHAARVPARIASKGGPALVLVQPGSFMMGTRRGEQGRQSNESQRPVKLTRAYYLGTMEISNAQFRRFRAQHSSGIIQRFTLNNEGQPVARVSWADAARFCNWLSAQDGLPPAYREDGDNLVLAQPATTGYRLPTEAEWEWAARFAGQPVPQRFPWGSGFPPPARAGNFADPRADGIAPDLLPNYDDGFAAAAPVGSFAPNALGLFDLGGNVAEWVHDFYDAVPAIGAQEVGDPTGPASGGDHVIRGSSWMHGRLIELRLAFRDSGHQARPDLGLRIARYAE